MVSPVQGGFRQRRFLVLHGFTNRRWVGHWQRLLTSALRDEGEQVVYPQLPDPDSPDVEAWLDVLTTELDLLGDPAEVERVVVAHSLGATLWLHACARGLEAPVERVLLVSPPGPSALAEEIPAFSPLPPLSSAQVSAAARRTQLVWSGDDGWCDEGVENVYGDPLGIPVTVLPGTGHLSLGDGFGPWPEVIAWCRDPDSVWR